MYHKSPCWHNVRRGSDETQKIQEILRCQCSDWLSCYVSRTVYMGRWNRLQNQISRLDRDVTLGNGITGAFVPKSQGTKPTCDANHELWIWGTKAVEQVLRVVYRCAPRTEQPMRGELYISASIYIRMY